MKVGIAVYTRTHYELVYTLIKIFEREYSQIVLFLSKDLYTEFSRSFEGVSSDVTFILKDAEDSIYNFFKKNKEVLNGLDFFISDEFYSLSILTEWKLPFILNMKCPKIITLHNVNLWLKPKLSLNIKHLAYMLLRRSLLRKFDEISVFSNNMKDYVIHHTAYKKYVYVIPFSFYSNESSTVENGNEKPLINITIPGTINKARRDYKKLLDTYEIIIKKKLPIKLVLLGYPIGEYGIGILNRCEDMNRRGGNIEYFKNFISKEVFEKKIKEASLLLSYITPKYYIKGSEEIYGLTKETCITWFAIKFVKPLILPKTFKNMTELNKSIINYDNVNALENILTKLNHKIIEELTNQALINSQNFTIDKFRKVSQFYKLIH